MMIDIPVTVRIKLTPYYIDDYYNSDSTGQIMLGIRMRQPLLKTIASCVVHIIDELELEE